MKELVMEVTSTLPDNATIDDFIEAICTRIKIQKGLKASKENNGLTTEDYWRRWDNSSGRLNYIKNNFNR